MNNLKQLLLNYKLVVDNEYLDQYILLVKNNRTTPKEKFKTQRHHIIPVAYYQHKYSLSGRKEALLYAKQDSANFEINLKFKDHLLAHYLLCLCAKDDWFKFSNSNMLSFTLPNFTKVDFNSAEFLNSLDNFQAIYEFACKYKQNDPQIKKNRADGLRKAWAKKSKAEKEQIGNKISKTLSGRKKQAMKAESKQKISDALLGHSVSESTKAKISITHKNKIYINKNGKAKTIDPQQLQTYLAAGWLLGNGKQGTIWVYKDNICKSIQKAELAKYLSIGFSLGHGHTTNNKNK